MRILLVRHGRSRAQDNEELYLTEGDHKVGLTKLGWQQAIAAGQFLRHYYTNIAPVSATAPLTHEMQFNSASEEAEPKPVAWPEVRLSPYQRPKETFSGILYGMNGAIPGVPKIYEDPRLIEKHFGGYNVIKNLLEKGGLDKEFAKVAAFLQDLSNRIYNADPYAVRPLWGESSKDTMGFVRSFIDGTLARDIAEGKNDFLFIVHGAVIKDFLQTWFHLPMIKRNNIPSPGNCDIIEIKGGSKKWTAMKIYDGEKMKPVSISVLEGIRRFGVEDLPPVPEEFRL